MGGWGGSHTRVELRKYKILKKTPKGAWIAETYGHGDGNYVSTDKKWTSFTAQRPFAHRTKEEALVAFVARKRAQIRILESKMERAKSAMFQAEDSLRNVRANAKEDVHNLSQR